MPLLSKTFGKRTNVYIISVAFYLYRKRIERQQVILVVLSFDPKEGAQKI